MRFVTFEQQGRTAVGVLSGDSIHDLSPHPAWRGRPPADLGALLAEHGPEAALAAARDALGAPSRTLAASQVRLRAPVLLPPQIVAVGLNYRDHCKEGGRPVPERPVLFAKARTAISGPGDPILIPAQAPKAVDLEAELAVVIGKPGERIPRDRALDWVFGFTVLNDVSARDVQKGDGQFFRGKSFKSFCPTGPAVATPDSFDWRAAPIGSRTNGEKRQDGNTRDLIFGVEELVAYISAVFPLEAGSLIATGTPAGVGVFRDPPVFLAPGDRVECEIAGIGVLANPVAAA